MLALVTGLIRGPFLPPAKLSYPLHMLVLWTATKLQARTAGTLVRLLPGLFLGMFSWPDRLSYPLPMLGLWTATKLQKRTAGTRFRVPAVSGSGGVGASDAVGVVIDAALSALTDLKALAGVADVALEDDWSGEDLLERAKENRLQRLGVVRRVEAGLAAVKALTVAEYVGIEEALTPPGISNQHQRAREISLIAEVGGILGLGAGAAADLVSTSYQLAATQPLTLAALAAGEITYQHARVLTDECTGLPHAGTTALETHFLTPTLPDPTLPDPALPILHSRTRSMWLILQALTRQTRS